MPAILFNGENVSIYLNKRLKALHSKVQQLHCKDVMTLTDEQIEKKAEEISASFFAPPVPTIFIESLGRYASESTKKKYFEVPFVHDKAYFQLHADGVQMGIRVDEITRSRNPNENRMVLVVETTSSEEAAFRVLQDISDNLECVRTFVDKQFPNEVFTKDAVLLLTKKKKECEDLASGGYQIT